MSIEARIKNLKKYSFSLFAFYPDALGEITTTTTKLLFRVALHHNAREKRRKKKRLPKVNVKTKTKLNK